jgi:DNA polymerase-1
MRLVIDIETNGFLDVLTTIHCIVAFDLNTETLYKFEPCEIRNGIKLMSEADVLVAHNGIKFDVPAIQKLYPDFKPKKVIDTLVCSRLIWSNIRDIDFSNKKQTLPPKLFGSHGLKSWGYRLGELKGEYGQQDNAWDVYTPEMLTYCEQDVRVTVKLYNTILGQNYSQQAIDLEHSVAEIMWKQECNGFVFDEKKAQSLYINLAEQRDVIWRELYSLFPSWIVAEGTKKPARTINYKDPSKADRTMNAAYTVIKIVEFNPSSRAHISNRLINKYGWNPKDFTDNGQAKIDETILSKLPYPEAKHVAKYFMLQKRLGQLAEGNQGWLRVCANGKIHGSVNTNNAATGRATHSHPNLAQIPSMRAAYGKECRELFTVPKGWKLMGADASGLELRALAGYMAIYDGGAYVDVVLDGDIHTVNQIAAGLASRDESKRFIYAFLYGGGDQLIGELVGGGAKEGKRIKKSFLDKTPALKKLREAVSKAAERGFIKGLDGRHIHIRSPHAALNFLLQSAGAIICKQWLVEFENEMQAQGYRHGWDGDYCMCAWVHDEIQVAVREDLADKVGHIAVQTIQKVTEVFNFRCPLDGEFNVGNSWAETH